MKKVFLAGVVTLGLGLMSFTNSSVEKTEDLRRPEKAFYTCEDGSDGFVYTNGFSDEDVAEMLNAACN